MAERAHELLVERERLAAALRAFPELKVFPSEANLLLVRVGKGNDGAATRVWKALAAKGIMVRNFDRPGPLAGCLRITPGTPAEDELLLAELPAAIATSMSR
jgi:histidinol-phosphate aminotransferase